MRGMGCSGVVRAKVPGMVGTPGDLSGVLSDRLLLPARSGTSGVTDRCVPLKGGPVFPLPMTCVLRGDVEGCTAKGPR